MVMINSLVDTGSPSFGEDLVVRVRGTFIDIGPDVSPKKRRSGSAPPHKGVFADEDPTCSNDSQYISEWIGRAMRLSDSLSATQQEALDEKCVKCDKVKRVANPVNKTVNAEETDQMGISLFDAEAMPPPEGTGGVTGSPGMADAYYQQMHGSTEYSMEGSAPKCFNIPGIDADRCLHAQVVATGKCFSLGVQDSSIGERSTPIGELSSSTIESRSAPIREPFTSRIASRNNWEAKCDSFDFLLGSWRGDVAPDPQPTLESRLRLEVPGPYKRLNLARNGPSKSSCHRWLEENILSEHLPQETPAAPEVTTLMICDIPCRQTIEQIIDVINQQGFANTFNLVYMPSKRPKYLQNMGYAFANFKTAEYATAFGEAFQNFRFPNSLSKKVGYTKPARHQGYTENVNRYIKQGAVGCLVTFDDAMHGGEGQKMCQ